MYLSINSLIRATPGTLTLATVSMLFLLTLITAPPVAAQTDESRVLEEVIVTATKRESSLQDLAMSITAIDSESLKLMGAEFTEDFVTSIPNVSFGFGGSGDGRNARSFAIRGISGSRTTGFYLDETPLPNFVDPRLVDIARVEVLRGPQGTLYGARSMGGTIRLISNQPDTGEFEGMVDASLSDTKEGDLNYAIEAVVNIPISQDRAALRLVAYVDDKDGYFDRTFPNESEPSGTKTIKNVNNADTRGIQASLRLTPTDRLDVLAKFAYHTTESDGASWTSELGKFDQIRLFDIAEFLDDEWTHAALNIGYSADRFDFISASSWFDRDFIENEDISEEIAVFFGGFEYPSPIDQVVEDERFTQEFRLTSNSDGPWQYLAGLYYTDVTISTPSNSEPPGFEAGFAEYIGLPGVPVFGGTDVIFNGIADVDVQELAAFGEVSYDVSEKMTLTAGARWFNVDIEVFALDTGIVADGIPLTGDTSESGINPKAALDYRFSDDVTLYASAAKGYRNGGVSGAIPEFCGEDIAAPATPFDSDSLWSYELGAKTSLAGNTVQLNGAVFYIDWDDIQQGKSYACGFGQVVNAGSAKSQGFDLEITAIPLNGLQITAGVGYADAKITSTEEGIVPKDGDRLLQVPEWTANASAYYEFPVSFADNAYFNLNYSYIGDSVTLFPDDPSYTPERAERDAYQLVHVRAGLLFGSWNTSIFVQNLFNEQANLSEVFSLGAEIPGLERYATNRPRTIGIQVRKTF